VNLGDALFHVAWSSTAPTREQPPPADSREPIPDEDEIL